MAFCSNCGTELNNGAKFCPNCGTRVGSSDRRTPMKKENDSNQEGLSTRERIALGVAGFVAFTGICGGFADGMWIVALLSLCALGAVCVVFMGIIEKKYAWAIAICSFFVVTMTIGLSAPDGDRDSSNTSSKSTIPQTERKQETEAESQAHEQKEEKERQESKKKKIAEEGYKHGYNAGFSCNYHEYETFHWDRMARQDYTAWHGAPTSSKEKELYQIFQDNYLRGVEEGYKAQN